MSEILNNPYLKGIRGKFAKISVYKKIQGRMHMTNMPAPASTITQKMLDRRYKFKEATHFAKKVFEDPELKALYDKGVTIKKNSAYVVAVSDFLIKPTVHEIDTTAYTGAVGQTITIKATDDFMVKSVHVTLVDAAGVEIEKGEAVFPPKSFDRWHYVTTVATATTAGMTVKVTAYDNAGNKTEAEFLK